MTLDTKDGLNKFVDENLSDMINQLIDHLKIENELCTA